MTYETFSFSTDEYAGKLTEQSHQTLYWLWRNGYLNEEQAEDLSSRMIVVPIRNHPNFGQRLINRFFGKDSQSNSFVFPITLLEDVSKEHDDTDDKPKLTVVK